MVCLTNKVLPVAATEAVLVTEVTPRACATVPVSVPPSMANLPVASIDAVPPAL